MALTNDDSKTKTEYVSMGKGTFPSRVVHVIDMGKQHVQGYNKSTKQWFPLFYAKDAEGNDIKNEEGYTKQVAEDTGYPVIRPTYRVTFEFPTKTREFNGKQMPRWMKKDYSLAGLKKLAESLSGGDVLKLAGSACFVQVGQTEGGNDKIVSVMPPIEGMGVSALANPAVTFDFDNPVKSEWNNIPSWYVDDIKKAVNYSGSKLEVMISGVVPVKEKQGIDDEQPF